MIVAELTTVAVSVQMPESVLHDCLTLRCIHTKFDTYSQNAKSYDPVIPVGGRDSLIAILDIEEVLANEWDMQLEIQEEILVSMLAKREAYEEIMRIITERTEKAKKEKDEANKSLPIPKPPKEPLKLPPDMLPDAINVFLEREQQDYIDLLDEIYNPQNLGMHPNEVNGRLLFFRIGSHLIITLLDQFATIRNTGRNLLDHVFTSTAKHELLKGQRNLERQRTLVA